MAEEQTKVQAILAWFKDHKKISIALICVAVAIIFGLGNFIGGCSAGKKMGERKAAKTILELEQKKLAAEAEVAKYKAEAEKARQDAKDVEKRCKKWK